MFYSIPPTPLLRRAGSPFMFGLCLASLGCTGALPIEDGQTTTTANDGENTGESTGAITSAADTSADTSTDTDEAPEAELVVIVVADQPFPDPSTPGAGALVAVDTPMGRIEVTADADGRAAFDGFSWSGAPIDVTVGMAEAGLRSRLGVVEADTNAGELVVAVAVRGAPTQVVEVYGSVTKSAPNHDLSFYATHGVSFSASGSSWSMLVAPDQPFTFVGLELDYLFTPPRTTDNPIFSWVTLEHPGISEPTELVVDLSMPTPSTQVSGAFVMPGRPESPLRGDSFGFVYSLSNFNVGPLVGRSTYTQVDPGGELCNFDIEYIEPQSAADPITCYRVLLPPAFEFSSTACELGYPSVAPVDIDILDTPELPFVDGRALHDPIEFEIFDADVTPNVFMYHNGDLVWHVSGPVDATSIVVPAPPTGFDAPGVILDAQLSLVREAPGGEYVERVSTSQWFAVET